MSERKTPTSVLTDELDHDRAMDVFYADSLPTDMPLADFEDAVGVLHRHESDGVDSIERSTG